METEELRRLSREKLVERATSLGIPRPRTLTQAELVDEIVRRSVPPSRQRRGWLGRARDLVATVVERGLHLPEAASLLRSTQVRRTPAPPPPLPTVTLAEIYAAQGYHAKAVTVLDEVLRREPDHAEARSLRDRFASELSASERADLEERQARAKNGHERPEAAREAPEPSDTAAPAPPVEFTTEPATDASARCEEPAPVVLETSFEQEDGSARAEPAPDAPSPDAPSPDAPSPDAPSSDAPSSDAPSHVEPLVASAEPLEATPAEADGQAPIEASRANEAVQAPAMDEAPREDGQVERSAPGAPGYDVDDVVALATDAETAFAYWEVRPLTFARLVKRHPRGRLVVRVLATRASERGEVSTSIRDVPVDELVDDVFLRGLPPGGEVRIAIGWKENGEIVPIAVAPELRMPHRFGAERPGLHEAPPSPPRPDPPYQRLLERAAPLTWVDLGGAPGQEAIRREVVEHEEIVRIERLFGGASDLSGALEEHRRRLLAGRGGASDLGFGAYGGASDLHRTSTSP